SHSALKKMMQPGSEARKATKLGFVAGGCALALYGVVGALRGSKSALGFTATGGLMALFGAGIPASPRTSHVTTSVRINCSPEEAYRSWRNFESFPRFMRHLQSVRMLDDRRSEWTALGPLETPVSWTAEIEQDRESELITWRSVPESEFQIRGMAEFR